MLVCPACGEENPSRFRLCGFCGTPLETPAAPQETRKLVTILFCDLKGSTSLGEALDSESLREVMSHYFEAMSEAITEHGGRIEKFIGDAVMAVFGLPRVHEDDALRAVRAARAMQHALVEINSELDARYGVRLTNRIGVNTGEVVAGDPTQGQRLVIGDPVNVAARLEQAAGDSEVLLGELTYRLTRDFVEVDDVEPLELKGKSERVAAYRLRELTRGRDGPEGSHRELVGRETELSALREAFERCSDNRSPCLVTLLAEAGAGKSRLINEFVEHLRDRAVVGRGRCLPYGRGITFWPLIEIVRELAAIDDDDAPDVAYSKLSAIAGDRAGDVAERVASVMGLLDRQFPIEEIGWATRRLLEIVAATRPLVVCFEDIHWAELTLLDLIEHLRSSEANVPMMIVCGGRPTLVEIRPDWPPAGDDLVITLAPLSDEQSARLVESLLGEGDLPDELTGRIVRAAGGNPLYVEQILSMLVEDGVIRRDGDRWGTAVDLSDLRIPPTIQALLAARLDLLSADERGVIEPAAVIGQIFVRPAVEALVPESLASGVHAQLASLDEKQLVHPDAEVGEAGYRFHHILIRDAAYQSLLKRTRAVLHERFVEWGERVNRERDRVAEYEEILGYHLEQAHGYLAELGPLDDHGRELGVRASDKLARAGRRSFQRGDMPAASNLLRRAVALRPADDAERLGLIPVLAEALMETGEFAVAEAYLDEAFEAATASRDVRLRADVLLTRLLVRHHVATDLAAWRAEVEAEASRAISLLEEHAAHAELAKAWRLMGFVHGAVCDWGNQVQAVRQALEHARLSGDERLEARLAGAYTIGLRDGPTPVPDAIARSREILERQLSDRQAEAIVRCSLACLLAMSRDFEGAREQYRLAGQLLSDRGGTVLRAFSTIAVARVELLAERPDEAGRELEATWEALGAIGERYFRPLIGALLAQARVAVGAFDEASRIRTEAESLADADDPETQALLRAVSARLLARAGAIEDALGSVQEAIEISRATDAPGLQANALVDLAAVLAEARREPESEAALAEAQALFDAKGDVASASRLGLRARST